jgi:hypothetical protein
VFFNLSKAIFASCSDTDLFILLLYTVKLEFLRPFFKFSVVILDFNLNSSHKFAFIFCNCVLFVKVIQTFLIYCTLSGSTCNIGSETFNSQIFTQLAFKLLTFEIKLFVFINSLSKLFCLTSYVKPSGKTNFLGKFALPTNFACTKEAF